MITSKITITILILTSVLLILFLIGRKSVNAEIVINAPTEEAWSVLTDINRVKEWNHVLIPIQGELKEGGKITYKFYQEENGKATTMEATVRKLIPDKLINQSGGISGVLTFNHTYSLKATEAGSIVRIEEKYRGIMVTFWNPQPVELAYRRLLEQLKERVEGAVSTSSESN